MNYYVSLSLPIIAVADHCGCLSLSSPIVVVAYRCRRLSLSSPINFVVGSSGSGQVALNKPEATSKPYSKEGGMDKGFVSRVSRSPLANLPCSLKAHDDVGIDLRKFEHETQRAKGSRKSTFPWM